MNETIRGQPDRYPLVAWGVRAAGTVAMLIGGFWLFTWLAGWAAQWSAAGRITMKTNMALGQLLSGVALLLLWRGAADRVRRAAGAGSAILVLLIGALTLFQHLFGFDLGIDQILAAEVPGAAATASPNRIGPPGSMSLALLGTAFLAQALGRKAAASYLGLAVCIINFLPAVGFLYGIPGFYTLPRLTGIAWPTVVALTSLGLGLVMSYTEGGPVAMLLRRDAGGAIFRKLLPVVILAPLALGFAWVVLESRGLVRTPTDTGLFVIVLVLLFGLMLWRVAARLSHEAETADAAHEALRQSEQKYTAIFDKSSFPIALTRMPEGVIVGANDTFLKLFGYAREDVTGKTSLELGIWDAGSRAQIDAEFKAKGAVRDFECVSASKSGARRTISLNLDSLTIEGVAYVLTTIMDITERKRAEETLKATVVEKEVLLRELSHRTKNNMQVICSLLSLQAATLADEKLMGALSDTQDRIRAMALVHEKLHQSSNFAFLSVREYIEDLLRSILKAHHGTARHVGTVTDIDDDLISIDSALPLGLIINELVSNSLKHAFPGRKSGTIKLSLKAAGERTELKYRDDGPGLPPDFELSRTGSLGLKLVNNLAVLQLGGTMEIRQNPHPEFVFTFGDLTRRKEENILA